MDLREWLWRRRQSTLSEDRISEIIAEIAPKYGIRCVAFKSDSPDGIVRPKDKLEIYVVNNGTLSYCGMSKFTGELMCTMNRYADFYHMGRKTKRREVEELCATIAYEETPVSEGEPEDP